MPTTTIPAKVYYRISVIMIFLYNLGGALDTQWHKVFRGESYLIPAHYIMYAAVAFLFVAYYQLRKKGYSMNMWALGIYFILWFAGLFLYPLLGTNLGFWTAYWTPIHLGFGLLTLYITWNLYTIHEVEDISFFTLLNQILLFVLPVQFSIYFLYPFTYFVGKEMVISAPHVIALTIISLGVVTMYRFFRENSGVLAGTLFMLANNDYLLRFLVPNITLVNTKFVSIFFLLIVLSMCVLIDSIQLKYLSVGAFSLVYVYVIRLVYNQHINAVVVYSFVFELLIVFGVSYVYYLIEHFVRSKKQPRLAL